MELVVLGVGGFIVFVLIRAVSRPLSESFRKADATAAVSNLLQRMAKVHGCDSPCFKHIDDASELIIRHGWELCPDAFNGKRKLKANEASLVCYSLAAAVTRAHQHSSPDFKGLFIALNEAIRDMEERAGALQPNAMDLQLIATSKAVLADVAMKEMNRERSPLESEIDALLTNLI